MENNCYPYSINENISCYNSNNSRNQIKSNNTVINLVNIIYDNEFVSLINELSSSLKDCFKLLNKLLENIKEISATLSNQTLYSKCLLKDYIMLNKNKNEKLLQVMDRLDIFENNRNLLDNNISFINVNITSFFDHAKTLFKKMKVTRNIKLNNIKNMNSMNGNSRINQNIYNNIKFNNFNSNYNSNNNSRSKIIKNKRVYSSYDNMKYKYRNQNTLQNSLSYKRNRSSKKKTENLLINSSDDINNDFLGKEKDLSLRQKTISFNLRNFMINNNKNKINNLFENSLMKKEQKINDNNNLFLNYCSLINNSKAKNNRKKVNRGNIQSLKNISSFKNEYRINNYFNNNINKNISNNSHIYNQRRINFNSNSNGSKNNIVNNQNLESIKIIDNEKKNDMDSFLAIKIIEYFTLIKNQEKNQMKIEKIKKYLVGTCLNIINKNNQNKTINKSMNKTMNNTMNREEHINNLKQNYLKNINISKNIYKDYNIKNQKNNLMRNTNEKHFRVYNSVENPKMRMERNENQNNNNVNNIIDILTKELNNKNEYIKRLNMLLNSRNKKYGIVKAQNFEIIQKRKLIILIKKEISFSYVTDLNNIKKIDELNNEINELKKIGLSDNTKNYKYKYELLQEEMNEKNKEIINLNNKLDEITKNNNSLLNKIDEINLTKSNLEQEKANLLLKIKKLEDLSQNKKMIITNSEEESIENFSDIIDEQSSENEREKNLMKENNKLQEKINKLQSELNNAILNENNKTKKRGRNTANNEYENCVEFDSIRKKKDKDKNKNYDELKIKEDLIEKLQNKIKELEKNNNLNNITNYTNIDEYTILSSKTYKELKWFLLTKKDFINNINYENTFWLDKEKINEEFIKQSKYEELEEDKIMMNYLKKLEEKENIISKLKFKIENMEKNKEVDEDDFE